MLSHFRFQLVLDYRQCVMRAIVVAMASAIVSGLLSVPAVAHADPCINGTVRGGGPGGDSFLCQDRGWLHVLPTSDGATQPLPPTCVRFPDKYMCPVDAPAPGLEWTTPGRWYPGH
ncbi:hypothetical protein BST11_06445 [Mycobacterium alsense]|uniref:DUF3761 domain-containing protein n=2 Tax=Mycobacterium alsense TaxID=324058 RepID=A0ABX3RFG8_9MYCO|nr:hypothetical protein BST11_06445 [Mycobacterium alsense]